MKQLLRPIVALLVATALFFVYTWDVDRVERSILADLQSQQLLFENPNNAVAIEFENAAGKVRLARPDGPGGDWRIVEPRELPAHNPAVNAYLENLRGARRHAVFVPEDLERYGLADPAVRVTLDFAENGTTRQRVIEFGTQPDALGKVYARVTDEDRIFTVSEWIYRQSQVGVSDLRARSLGGDALARALKLRVRTARETFSIHRADATTEQWQLQTSDSNLPADRVLVERVVANLTQGTMMQVLDNPTSSTLELGLEPALATVEADGVVILSIGNRIPKKEQLVVEAADGTLGIAPASLFVDLFRPSPEWGTKRLVWLDPSEITQIETSSANTRMMLLRDEKAGWIFATMPGVPVRRDAMQQFLDNVSAFTAMRLVRANLPKDEYRNFGIVDESYTLLATASDGRVQGLRFGRTDTREGTSFMLREQDSSLWQVDFRAQNRIFRFAPDLEERRLVPDLRAQVAYFEVESRGNVVRFEKTPAAWRVELPGQRPTVVRPDRINAFLDAFQAMEIEAEMISAATYPSQAIFRFATAVKETPFSTVELLTRSASTGRGLFRIDNRQLEVSSERFEAVDELMAEMLIGARLSVEQDQAEPSP